MKQAELVYYSNGTAATISKGTFSLMQWMKTKLKKEPQFNKGELQVRTIGAKEYQPLLKKQSNGSN